MARSCQRSGVPTCVSFDCGVKEWRLSLLFWTRSNLQSVRLAILRVDRALGVRLVVIFRIVVCCLTHRRSILSALGFTKLGSTHPDVRSDVESTEQQHHDDGKDDFHLIPLSSSMRSTRHAVERSRDKTLLEACEVELPSCPPSSFPSCTISSCTNC